MSVIDQLYDRNVGIFSPEGRLLQVEYAFQAISSTNITAAAIKSPNSVTVVVEKRVPSALIVEEDMSSFHQLTPNISCLIIGREDAQASVREIIVEAAYWKRANGIEISIDRLATMIANMHQQKTQGFWADRIRGIVVLLASYDQEIGPQLISIDPAGNYICHVGAGIGVKKNGVNTFLEKKFAEKSDYNEHESVQLCLAALQDALDKKLASDGVEVLQCTEEKRSGRRLTTGEIGEYLDGTADAERMMID